MANLRRLFVPDSSLKAGVACLSEDESHYARKVLRLSAGTPVEIFNGAGRTANALVEPDPLGQKKRPPPLTVRIEAVREQPRGHQVVLGCAQPKGDRADWLVEKLAELGVGEVQWLTFAHSVPEPRAQARHERLTRVALSGLRQSRQAHLLKICQPIHLATFLAERRPAERRFVAHPTAQARVELFQGAQPEATTHLLIGPEAGLTPDELQEAQRAGYSPIQLGKHILRIETAALASAAGVLI